MKLEIIIDKNDIEIRKKNVNSYSEYTPNECRLNNTNYELDIIIKKMLIKIETPQKNELKK